ncbi:MAG: DUF4383 domain-containing protein [Anaerolineae bacterium]
MKLIQYGVLYTGILYVVLGVLGFLPIEALNPLHDAASHTRYMLLHFAVNELHNIVHLAIGVTGVFAARTLGYSRLWGKVWGVTLVALFVIGIGQALLEGLPNDQLLLGLVPLNSPGHMLHLVTGLIALYLGFAKLPEEAKE